MNKTITPIVPVRTVIAACPHSLPYQGRTLPLDSKYSISFAAELDGHVLGTLCAVTMALLTNRLDLCIQGLFGAGKSKSMAVLILALLELDATDSLKILFICKENSGTRSFADLLLWLDPPSGVLGRIGRLVGDQERNKSSYSHTKFDINPRERRQMLNKCQPVMATGGTIAQDLTMQWSTLGGFMQDLSLLVIDEGQQYRSRNCGNQPAQAATPCPVDWGLTANARRHCPGGTQCQKISPAPVGQKTDYAAAGITICHPT